MNEYRHHVSGFFASKEEAQGAMTRLVERGLTREQLQLFSADATPPTKGAEADSNNVLKNVLVDGAVGTAIGTGLGALAQVALVATSVSLFVASPLVAPLVMMGWGASLGAIVGAVTGATTGVEKKDGRLADLIQDAIMNGQFVLLATTRNEQETTIAREVINESVAELQDVATV